MIKYRAWDKTDKRMISWGEICNEWSGDDGHYSDILINDNYIPMQFTGATINDQDIYRGDVLKSLGRMHTVDEGKVRYHKVVWNKEYYQWFCFNLDTEIDDETADIKLWSYIQFERGVELVGNLLDNPELVL